MTTNGDGWYKRLKIKLAKYKVAKAKKARNKAYTNMNAAIEREKNKGQTTRTKSVSRGLRGAGLSDAEIRRLRGGR